MSDIRRYTVCCHLASEKSHDGPHQYLVQGDSGPYVLWEDHHAEVERLKADVERLTARHSEMEIYMAGLTDELHRTRSNGITLRWVEGEVEQLTAQRDKAEAEVERLTQELDGRRATNQRLIVERERLQDLLTLAGQELSTLRDRLRVLQADPSDQLDKARAQVEWLKYQVATLTVAVEKADEAKTNAEAAAAREEAETDRVTAERDEARAEVERLKEQVATLTAGMEWADKLQAYAEAAEAETDRVVADGNKALAEVERLTIERDEAREKLTRVQMQYDEFAKVTAKVIDNHQRERDHARQQAYLLREAGADRPTDEDIWREAFMALCGQSLEEGYMIRAESADAALAVYRQRWPR